MRALRGIFSLCHPTFFSSRGIGIAKKNAITGEPFLLAAAEKSNSKQA
jgi:hypothetical protein